jgi:hypothetical protein
MQKTRELLIGNHSYHQFTLQKPANTRRFVRIITVNATSNYRKTEGNARLDPLKALPLAEFCLPEDWQRENYERPR